MGAYVLEQTLSLPLGLENTSYGANIKYVFGSGYCVLHLCFFSFFFFFLFSLLLRMRLEGQTATVHEQQSYIVDFSAPFINPMGPVNNTRDPQTSLFSNFFIKNGSHSTIHTFKNYFVTVFSVFSFSKINSIQTNPKFNTIFQH